MEIDHKDTHKFCMKQLLYMKNYKHGCNAMLLCYTHMHTVLVIIHVNKIKRTLKFLVTLKIMFKSLGFYVRLIRFSRYVFNKSFHQLNT